MINAKYAFNIGKKKIPENILLNISSIDEFISIFTNNDYYFFEGRYDEAGDYIFIAFVNMFKQATSNFFINKITKEIQGGTQLMQDKPNFPYPIAAKGSFFISYTQPYDIIANLSTVSDKFVSKEDMEFEDAFTKSIIIPRREIKKRLFDFCAGIGVFVLAYILWKIMF